MILLIIQAAAVAIRGRSVAAVNLQQMAIISSYLTVKLEKLPGKKRGLCRRRLPPLTKRKIHICRRNKMIPIKRNLKCLNNIVVALKEANSVQTPIAPLLSKISRPV